MAVESGGISPEQLAALAAFLVIGAGMVAGLTGRIVVYRDYLDVVWCFALLVVPLVSLWFGLQVLGEADPDIRIGWAGLCGLIALGLLAFIAKRTWEDNGGVLSSFLALVTKVPLAVLYVGALLQAAAPSGRTQQDRNKNRGLALAGLFLLTPLLMALTRDKEGFGRRGFRWG